MSEENRGNPIVFYLGIEGEQSGPFSKEELISLIQQGLISKESLVWWEGQADWVELTKCAHFSNLFKAMPSAPKQSPAPGKLSAAFSAPSQKSTQSGNTWIATYLPQGEELAPVYDREQSTFAPPHFLSKRASHLAILVLVSGFLIWGFLELTSPSQKAVAPKKMPVRASNRELRRKKLSEASSSLLLKPDQSLADLKQLVEQNKTDPEGLEAAEVLLNYYRQNKQIEPAAALLLNLDRPEDAAKLLLSEPRLAKEAEKALFLSFKKTTGKTSADYLIEDINLILKSLNEPQLAKERILLLEKTFPALNHPFSYYLLSPDQRIKSIFTRISFKLVDGLASHMADEFPQLALATRPIVEVKRTPSGSFRIVGRYSGDLALKTDRLKGIYFLYWLVDTQWILVDTNLTSDRQNFASATRRKYESSMLTSSQMLTFLENEFKKTYPNQGLHESPVSQSAAPSQVKD